MATSWSLQNPILKAFRDLRMMSMSSKSFNVLVFVFLPFGAIPALVATLYNFKFKK
jgi:hypothetical protein